MADTDILSGIPAIVLAGGRNSDEMRRITGVDNRALVELTPGRTMLSYVLDAVLGAQSVGEIVVVGDVPVPGGCRSFPPGATLLDNLLIGVDSLPRETDKVLIVTSDIPFITAEAIDSFIAESAAARGNFCYPIIPMETYRKQFAGMKRTTLKLAEGEFTGGNIMVLSADFVRTNKQSILSAYAARKDILRLGSMLGWSLLLKIILSQTISPKLLDIGSLETGVSRVLGHGAVARAIITHHPSLGTDVDKPDDVVAARQILASK